jgi:hypothetical protein
MAKIKTSLLHRANKKVSFDTLGIISFNENCEAEIDDSKLDELKKIDTSIFVPGDKSLKDIDVDSEEVKPESNNNDETLDLSVMNVKQLKECAKESNLPEEEWKNLKKEELIAYLQSKL